MGQTIGVTVDEKHPVWVVHRQGSLEPGEVHATGSKGNLHTTETYRGQRVQKFVLRGLGPVSRPGQGVVWP